MGIFIGSIRGEFFISQLDAVADVTYPKTGDFKVFDFTFEMGEVGTKTIGRSTICRAPIWE